MASVPTSIRPMDFGSKQRQLKEALSTYNDEEVDVQTIESDGIDVFAVVSMHIGDLGRTLDTRFGVCRHWNPMANKNESYK